MDYNPSYGNETALVERPSQIKEIIDQILAQQRELEGVLQPILKPDYPREANKEPNDESPVVKALKRVLETNHALLRRINL